MATYRATVDIMGSDPLGLREQAESTINGWLLGEPAGLNEEECGQLADSLLRRFWKTLAPNTTGADALAVSVEPVE